MVNGAGRVVQILGGVVDVEFSEGNIPALFEAITVEREGKKPLVLEVQKHLGNHWVRTVSMDSTDGLRRGVPAIATGAPIMVPVGPSTLGRIFNVLGEPIDEKGPVNASAYYPIHRSAPSFEEQSTRVEVFETGVKYQMYHSLALILLGILFERFNSQTTIYSGYFFLAGMVFFCGSLYLLSTRSILGIESWKFLGPITPIGGLCFIIGWILLVFSVLKHKSI